MRKETFGGFSNRETWCVNEWMKSTYETRSNWLAESLAVKVNAKDKYDAMCMLSNIVSDHYKSAMPKIEKEWGELLFCAFARVNWSEIAEAWLED